MNQTGQYYKTTTESNVMYLKGVGPQRAKVLAEIDIHTIGDLLYHYPRRYLDRTVVKRINELRLGDEAVVIGRIESFGIVRARRRAFFQLVINDGTGHLTCQWFNGISWISDKFTVGEHVAVFGKVDFYNGLKIVHPDFDNLDEGEDPVNTGKVLAQYPSNANLKATGLDSRGFRRIVNTALEKLDIPPADHLDNRLLSELGLIPLSEALKLIHQPENIEDLTPATYRLKFDEHLFMQLLMALRRQTQRDQTGRVFAETGPYVKAMYNSLPFELTQAQIKVLREIRADLASPHQMNRLLQGDVGSGKTVVAMLTAAIVIGHDAQAAVMAPTEILAEQHFASFKKYCNLVGIKSALLKGGMKEGPRRVILDDLKNGTTQLIVGTHALIQEDVKFKDLALIIVDEQHRFGVMQRKDLINKGQNPDVLAMTATPIPRTLAITYHGDMDVSIIDELPAGRKPIQTRVVEPSRLDDVYEYIRKEVTSGRQCFIIYPLIEESEKLDLKAVETGFKKLKKDVFPEFNCGLVHGKMKAEERDLQMTRFSQNKIQILVATTVIEVGIDVPNATVMLIENAERFGLSQLHQLRGRIGRGEHSSVCILVRRNETEESIYRLAVMESTNDGFIISEKDLKLRGPGELFGKKQHGYLKAKLANLADDGPIIRIARQAAFSIIRDDPRLLKPQNRLLKDHFILNYKSMLEFVNIS